ncbi:MAG TPA: lmo0937 family membrane protein [Opitutaceae bacterium]|nr:lmo0937 family membrane protein [Opitutaceae bacterium]
MLETVAITLVLLWFAGIVSSYTLGGYINVLLFFALITIVVRVMCGRDPLK